MFVQTMKECLPKSIEYYLPPGGYFLWLKLPQGISSKAVHHTLLSQQITVAHGALFSVDEQYQEYLRLNTSLPIDDNLCQALRKLGELLH